MSLLWNYDPFREMEKMQRQLDLFSFPTPLTGPALTSGEPGFREGEGGQLQTQGQGGQLQTFGGTQGMGFLRPVIDVKENDKNIIVHAELPGLKKEDINIEVKDNILTLSGEKKYEKRDEKEKSLRLERSYGKFQRSMMLPEGVDPAKINAKCENGVLEVQVPKPQGKSQGQKVLIR